MNKILIIFGVAVLLICVGLSGCTDTEGDKQIVSLSELIAHPYRYENKTITVKASSLLSEKIEPNYPFIITDNEGYSVNVYVNKEMRVIARAEYYWIGTVNSNGNFYVDRVEEID